MRSLWLFVMPLVFLPDLGQTVATQFGTLELSDRVLFPFIILTWLAGRSASGTRWKEIEPLVIWFAVWAGIASLTILFRYSYSGQYYWRLSTLKWAKIVYYGVAGFAVIRALASLPPRYLDLYRWSLLATVLVVAVSLLNSPEHVGSLAKRLNEPRDGYEATNAVSVSLAMLLSYFGGHLALGLGTKGWRRITYLTLPLAIVGFLFSEGRGGWVALLVAILYTMRAVKLSPALIGVFATLGIVGVITYQQAEVFRVQIDKTFDPTTQVVSSDFAQQTGVDDGGRISIWVHELSKLRHAPLFGSGIFHRGGQTGLSYTGSHNMLIQMLLETGLIGGLLYLGVFWRLWRMAKDAVAGLATPTRAALVAGVVGAVGGEYFYGGPALLALFLVLAPALAQPRALYATAPSGHHEPLPG